MDNLVDEAPNRETARVAIEKCSRLLEIHFTRRLSGSSCKQLYTISEMGEQEETKNIELSLQSSISLLPVSRLTINPFIDLLLGFETDLLFCSKTQVFPIATEKDLEKYAYQVAGTIAISVLELLYSHHKLPQNPDMASERCQQVVKAGSCMGQALQYVNIARDVEHDAAIGRVYIPTSWLREAGLTPCDVLAQPKSAKVERLRYRLLDKADACYQESVGAIDDLPSEGRGGIRTTIESYMIIGKMIRENKSIDNGSEKLKVPLGRRLRVAWWAMC
jgi:15-cis-phytoene synthase/lycopene beta-cyclase